MLQECAETRRTQKCGEIIAAPTIELRAKRYFYSKIGMEKSERMSRNNKKAHTGSAHQQQIAERTEQSEN